MARETVVSMSIPRSQRGTVLLVTAAIYGIIVVSTAAALFNLAMLMTMPMSVVVMSVIWLAFLYWQTAGSCKREGGVRQFVINRVGEFSPRQFAEIATPDAEPAELRFGYRLFSRRYYYLKVRCEGIRSVDWGPGQATSLAGRDMNDWQVAVWFDRALVTMDPSSYKCRVHVFGPPRRKQYTETLGREFIGFLRDAGVAAAQGDDAALRNLIGKCGTVLLCIEHGIDVRGYPDCGSAHADGFHGFGCDSFGPEGPSPSFA